MNSIPGEKKRWWIRGLSEKVGNQSVHWSEELCMQTQLLQHTLCLKKTSRTFSIVT